jgi:uncharacterized protein (TIGR00297 family)
VLNFTEIITAMLFLAFFSVISLKKKSFDKKGIAIGIAVGLLTLFLGSLNKTGGMTAFLFMAYFFVLGELSTKYREKKRKGKHETRTTGNILGNSLASVIALGLNYPIGFFAGISAALADTLSSEIGMLSAKKPLLITSFKEVETGTDGGITLLGCVWAFIGSALIALMHYALYLNALFAAIILVAGLIGAFTDSILGAVLERKGKISNTLVNLTATSIAVITAIAIASRVV